MLVAALVSNRKSTGIRAHLLEYLRKGAKERLNQPVRIHRTLIS
jgi:hypothetical protein